MIFFLMRSKESKEHTKGFAGACREWNRWCPWRHGRWGSRPSTRPSSRSPWTVSPALSFLLLPSIPFSSPTLDPLKAFWFFFLSLLNLNTRLEAGYRISGVGTRNRTIEQVKNTWPSSRALETLKII